VVPYLWGLSWWQGRRQRQRRPTLRCRRCRWRMQCRTSVPEGGGAAARLRLTLRVARDPLRLPRRLTHTVIQTTGCVKASGARRTHRVRIVIIVRAAAALALAAGIVIATRPPTRAPRRMRTRLLSRRVQAWMTPRQRPAGAVAATALTTALRRCQQGSRTSVGCASSLRIGRTYARHLPRPSGLPSRSCVL